MGKNRKLLLVIVFVLFGLTTGIISANEKAQTVASQQESKKFSVLTIENFIALAATNDTVFESILIDELRMNMICS